MVTTKKTTTKKTVSKRKTVKKTMKGYALESPEYGKLIEEMSQIQNYVNKSRCIIQKINCKGNNEATSIYIKDPMSLTWFIGQLNAKREELLRISEDNVVEGFKRDLRSIAKDDWYKAYEVKFFKTSSTKGKPFKTIKF